MVIRLRNKLTQNNTVIKPSCLQVPEILTQTYDSRQAVLLYRDSRVFSALKQSTTFHSHSSKLLGRIMHQQSTKHWQDLTGITNTQSLSFTRESSNCFQCVLAIAILSVSPSVCLSNGWISQARITKSLPSAAWKTLVSGTVKLSHKFKGDHPERGR